MNKNRKHLSVMEMEKDVQLSSLQIEAIDRLMNNMVRDSVPGAQLLISSHNEILLKRGYGVADIQSRRKVTSQTPFLIASLTKQFVGLAVMKLVKEGKLNYGDLLSDFYPEMPDYAGRVTIKHMLTHTSGIKEYFPAEDMDVFIETYGEDLVEDDIFGIIIDEKELDFESGSKFKYSNSGYILLSGIIRKLTGMSFNKYIEKCFFEPAGMTSTSAPETADEVTDERAIGYFRDENEKLCEEPFNNVALGWADGNVVSNVEDLYRWHNMLMSSDMMEKSIIYEAYEPFVLNSGKLSRYGHGWWINNRRGIEEVWHSGITMGYSMRMSRFLEEDVCIVLLTNLTFGKMHRPFNEIVEIVVGERFDEVLTVDSPREVLKRITGNFFCRDSYCNISYCNHLDKLVAECNSVHDALFIDGIFNLDQVDEMMFRLDSSDDFYLKFNEDYDEFVFILNGHEETYIRTGGK